MNIFKRNKKINFEKEDLVLCKIALVTDCKIVGYGNNIWDYSVERTFCVLPEIRILIREFSKYIEPDDYINFKIFRERTYKTKENYLTIGDRIVKETNNIPIQHLKKIPLTEKERRTGRITLKRIKELEDLLNSK